MLLIAVQALVLLALGAWLVRTVQQARAWKQGGAPWVPTNVRVVGPALERLIPEGSQVWEVGAGDGRVAGYLAKRGYLVTAIERDRHLLALGQVLHTRVSWMQGDLRELVVPAGVYVYAYLTPALLHAVWDRLPKGSVLVTLSFAVPGVSEVERIEVPGWQGELKVYRKG